LGDVQRGTRIGSGQFSTVYKSIWHGTVVAEKVLKDQSASDDFAAEVEMFVTIGAHPRITQFLGACHEPGQLSMLLTFMPSGSLDQLLIEQGNFPVDSTIPHTTRLMNIRIVLQMALDASAGILHCHSRGVLHRDIGARNFLADSKHQVFASDFGMSVSLSHGATEYTDTKSVLLPIAYVAPETLTNSVWSYKTDVYSFGIFLFEIFARTDPYPGKSLLKEVAPGVIGGIRPNIPGYCPMEIAKLMLECWSGEGAERPTMDSVNQRIKGYLDTPPVDFVAYNSKDLPHQNAPHIEQYSHYYVSRREIS